MPTYDYECDACGHKFEKFQPMTAAAIRKCPKCGRVKVRRLIGMGGGIIFKGGGFHQTDYRNESYHKDAKKDAPAPEPCAKCDKADSGSCPAAKKSKN